MRPGDLFVALPGEHKDGHDFVDDALTRGATGLLVQRLPTSLPDGVVAYVVDDTLAALQSIAAGHRAALPVEVIGVTGSVGKTTTKEIAAFILGQRYRVLKNEANYNNEIGLPLTLLRLTPRHERAVLEMGMYAPGEIRLLCELARPRVGVVTNVGPVHLERLGSIEAIAAAKAELVEALPADGVRDAERRRPARAGDGEEDEGARGPLRDVRRLRRAREATSRARGWKASLLRWNTAASVCA